MADITEITPDYTPKFTPPSESLTMSLLKTRDASGFLLGVPHKFKPNSSTEVDWRAMVPIEYLYFRPERKAAIEKKYGKKIEEIDLTTTKVDDSDLVITLAGIRYLLKLRGYNSLIPQIVSATDTFVSVSCLIKFFPNIETNYQEVVHGDNACAHPGNTKSFGRNYLVEIATNRAMCRAVRAFLNINIVSKEELGEDEPSNTDFSSNISPESLVPVLRAKMEKYGYTFDQIIAKIVSLEPNAKSWNKLEDLSSKWIVWCLERIEQKAKNKD